MNIIDSDFPNWWIIASYSLFVYLILYIDYIIKASIFIHLERIMQFILSKFLITLSAVATNNYQGNFTKEVRISAKSAEL